MRKIIYIGTFSRLVNRTFGERLHKDFLNKNLPFIIYDYDEMKRKCSDICVKFNYEYMDEYLFLLFINKWRKIHQDYNQDRLDIDNLQKVDY